MQEEDLEEFTLILACHVNESASEGKVRWKRKCS